MKYKDLKGFAEKTGLSQSLFARALEQNGFATSQPSVYRWFQPSSLSREVPADLARAFEILKRKHELGLLRVELEMSELWDRSPEKKKGSTGPFPASQLLDLSPTLIRTDEDSNVSTKEGQDTIIKMATAGMSETARAEAEEEFLGYLKRWLARVPFAINAFALYLLIKRDRDLVKVAPAIGALLYFISPIDLLPDYIPVAGFLDDASVIAAVCTYFAGEIKPFLKEAEHEIQKLKGRD